MIAALGAATPAPADDGVDDEAGALPEGELDDRLETPGSAKVEPGRRYTESDFAPYFSVEPLTRAKRAFDHGQYALARKLLQSDAGPVRYLRALSALRLKKDAVAAEELTSLAA